MELGHGEAEIASCVDLACEGLTAIGRSLWWPVYQLMQPIPEEKRRREGRSRDGRPGGPRERGRGVGVSVWRGPAERNQATSYRGTKSLRFSAILCFLPALKCPAVPSLRLLPAPRALTPSPRCVFERSGWSSAPCGQQALKIPAGVPAFWL